MTKTFEEVPVATVEVIPTFDGNEIKFKPLSKLESYLIAEGEVELYLRTEHQPLPEVPEFVAEYIEKFRKSNAFHSIKNLVSGDEYYTYPGLSDEVKNWISENIAHQELLVRAWINGYTVQKPKRFYLKNKLTGSLLIHINSGYKGDYCEMPENVLSNKESAYFTQEEIDSMNTGSYEKIPVEMSKNG